MNVVDIFYLFVIDWSDPKNIALQKWLSRKNQIPLNLFSIELGDPKNQKSLKLNLFLISYRLKRPDQAIYVPGRRHKRTAVPPDDEKPESIVNNNNSKCECGSSAAASQQQGERSHQGNNRKGGAGSPRAQQKENGSIKKVSMDRGKQPLQEEELLQKSVKKLHEDSGSFDEGGGHLSYNLLPQNATVWDNEGIKASADMGCIVPLEESNASIPSTDASLNVTMSENEASKSQDNESCNEPNEPTLTIAGATDQYRNNLIISSASLVSELTAHNILSEVYENLLNKHKKLKSICNYSSSISHSLIKDGVKRSVVHLRSTRHKHANVGHFSLNLSTNLLAKAINELSISETGVACDKQSNQPDHVHDESMNVESEENKPSRCSDIVDVTQEAQHSDNDRNQSIDTSGQDPEISDRTGTTQSESLGDEAKGGECSKDAASKLPSTVEPSVSPNSESSTPEKKKRSKVTTKKKSKTPKMKNKHTPAVQKGNHFLVFIHEG